MYFFEMTELLKIKSKISINQKWHVFFGAFFGKHPSHTKSLPYAMNRRPLKSINWINDEWIEQSKYTPPPTHTPHTVVMSRKKNQYIIVMILKTMLTFLWYTFGLFSIVGTTTFRYFLVCTKLGNRT